LIRDTDPAIRDQIAERVRHAVFAMVMAGRADISVLPLWVGQADQNRPAAWKLARMEAVSGQAWITSLRHTGVPALPVLRFLLPCLDGTRDHVALRAALADALRSGAVPMPEPPTGQDAVLSVSLEMVAEDYLGQTLRYLSRQALLAPEG
jgi:hypothetical protein